MNRPKRFRRTMRKNLDKGGLLLVVSESVEVREPVKVLLRIAKKRTITMEAEVVYAAPYEDGFQVGVEFRGDWEQQLVGLKRLSNERDRAWGKDSESVQKEIENLPVHEKIQIALKGGREERRVLMKTQHHMVHSHLLRNPRITSEEIASFARMPSLKGDMILTISNNPEWMNNDSIRASIVKNPKTPANIVQKYIGKLRDQELLQIAKMGRVRDIVARMAKKILAQRGKPVQ